MKKILGAISGAIVFLSVSAQAQEFVHHFDKGFTVAVLERTVPKADRKSLTKNLREYFVSQPKSNKLGRGLVDEKNKIVFGYNLEVKPMADSNKFSVTIRSDGTAFGIEDKYRSFEIKSLPETPGTIVVNDGDTIALDLLEHAESNVRIQDLIKVTRERKEDGGYFLEFEEPQDFSIQDVQMQLVSYKVYINGKFVDRKVPLFSTISHAVEFSFKNRGRIIMSPFPDEKYGLTKIGRIEDNKIVINYKGDKYEIVSEVSIMGNGKKWNLWGLFRPETESAKAYPGRLAFTTKEVNSLSEFFEDSKDKRNVNVINFDRKQSN